SVHTEAFAASDSAGQVNGLIVERAGEKLRILAAVVQSELTNAELAILLRAAAADATSIQVYNEPEGSLFLARCRELGFSEFFSQHEMVLDL
ncbi:MAG: hypothetical protein J2P37_31125, partial [Ktedonobacteraceae bacterium]|nr:hypothetical protein [Ktedonobacteraceae bacterium]